MDLSSDYMGLKLKNPLILSASPLTAQADNFKKIEDAGIAAIVMHSLFEEQIRYEANELEFHTFHGTETYAEALSYFPEPKEYVLGPEPYLEQIRKAKKSIKIPVIGSLNGYTPGGWTRYAKLMEDAGADALELNIYFLSTSVKVPGAEIERAYVELVKSVKAQVKIPLAVKLNPFFSSIAGLSKDLEAAGADGVVMFNRFYQPDIDIEKLAVVPNLDLSTYRMHRLPLRWIAILYGQLKMSLAATGGVLEAQDAVKMIMAGADAVMVCSTLLKNGIGYAATLLADMEKWMTDHGYASVSSMKGIMSQKSCPAPELFERANYLKVLGDYKGETTR